MSVFGAFYLTCIFVVAGFSAVPPLYLYFELATILSFALDEIMGVFKGIYVCCFVSLHCFPVEDKLVPCLNVKIKLHNCVFKIKLHHCAFTFNVVLLFIVCVCV